MYLVAIAWIYVTLLMALTETTVARGVITFALYGVFPLSIVLYLLGTPVRRRARRAREQAAGTPSGKTAIAGQAASRAEPAGPDGASEAAASAGPGAPAKAGPAAAAAGPASRGLPREAPDAGGTPARPPDADGPARPGQSDGPSAGGQAARADAPAAGGPIQTQAAMRPVTPSRRNE